MNRLARFAAAQNYALYYGTGKEKELSQFDVAVIEPSGQNDASVHSMQAAGTLLLAYLSVIEAPPSAPEIKLLQTEDFLTQGGCRLTNQEYGNFLIDLRSNRWKGLLWHKIGNLIWHAGYDGVFLDTIGNVESPELSAIDTPNTQLLAAAHFVRQLRTTYPGHILVQNNGLEQLCFLTSAYLNGICWENPPFHQKTSRRWVKQTTHRLAQFKKKYGLQVWLLLEEKVTGPGVHRVDAADNFQLAKEIAAHQAFLLYQAPVRYVGGISPLRI